MYKALNYWVFGGFAGAKSAYEFIDFAAEEKLDGIELTVGDAIPVDLDADECAGIKAYAESKNVGLRTLASGAYWGMSLGSPDPAERAKAMDFTRQYLRLASNLGVETILVIPAYSRVAWDDSRPTVAYRDAWNYSVASLREIAPLAEELGVNIGLENVWNRFLFSPMEWKFYLDEINSERIGIYFDAGNACLYVRPEDYVSILGRRIKAVHVKNWTGENAGGSLLGFGDDMTQGEVNFTTFFAALDAIGYTGTVTAEMIPFARGADLVLPDLELARRTAATMRNL